MSQATVRAITAPARPTHVADQEAVAAALLLVEEIASQASALRSLAAEAYGHDDRELVDALVLAMGQQIARIGWISELAHEKLGGAPYVTGVEAADWILPAHLARLIDRPTQRQG